MKKNRIFIGINLALVVLGGACVYYLALAANAEMPPELAEAEVWIRVLEAEDDPTGRTVIDPEALCQEFPALCGRLNPVMRVLYTPEPTPPPTPKPTPAPVPLSTMINSWAVVSMDDTLVIVVDQKTGAEIELLLNGPAHTVTFQNDSADVTVTEINFDEGYVEFKGNGQSVKKSL